MSSRQRVDVPTYLASKIANGGADQEWWIEFERLYSRRLWHQLTIKLLSFVCRPGSLSSSSLMEVYVNFLSDFEMKLNPLYLVEIISFIVRDDADSLSVIRFLSGMKEKVKSNNDASILTSILICRLKLKLQDLTGVKEILDEISPLIDAETGVTPVHARYFQLSSDFHQLLGNHNEYFRDALRYLGCISLHPSGTKEKQVQDQQHELTPEERKNIAFALALAALLGDAVYNFGELLQHPIANEIRQHFDWLHHLLTAFNAGDVKEYERLRPKWTAQPDLQRMEILLRKKISLLSLMEITFKSTNGCLKFQEIADAAALPMNEVELLVMKALSLNLVKGTIDEVDQVVHLTWVQPRVLDHKQISMLKHKIDSWCKEVKQIEHLVQGKAQDFAC